MSGMELIKALREEGKQFPILILTARSSWQDKVDGLKQGADDYLVKPFPVSYTHLDVYKRQVTVKCRLGVDDDDDYGRFRGFIDQVADAGCGHFVIHARNAWLKGLSPKENREVPPLRYDWAYRLKDERPDLRIELNGGIRDFDTAQAPVSDTHLDVYKRQVHHYPRG